MLLRPTSGKVREAIFNLITPLLNGGSVLDLFAGTGSLGIEALSRGMERTVFVERDPRVITVLHKNIIACQLKSQTEVIGRPVSKGLRMLRAREERFKLIFLDPPYQMSLAGRTLLELGEANLLKKDGLVILEHSEREQVEPAYGAMKLDDRRHYGQTVISFFTCYDYNY